MTEEQLVAGREGGERFRPALPAPERADHRDARGSRAIPSDFSATASTMPRLSRPPTWASRSIRRSISPRNRPISSCSNGACWCSRMGSSRDGAYSQTSSNTLKWARVRISGTCSASWAAAIFLPFLPMAPIQVLLNNLLYDISQTSIPTDRVDRESVAKPLNWDISFIRRFMIVLGPISSIFDYATFVLMLFFFKCRLFISAGDHARSEGPFRDIFSIPAGSWNRCSPRP